MDSQKTKIKIYIWSKLTKEILSLETKKNEKEENI